MDRAKNFLEKIIPNDSQVVVACSGGPDSMCLLDLVCQIKSLKNLQVIVTYVNHNLRTNSLKEQEYLKKFTKEYNLLFETIDLDFQNKFNEQMGHQERYKFFKSILKKYDTKYLLMAHHGDDLIETILMRLSRGSNLEGYSGFKNISNYEDMIIIRPLIYVTKDDILKYNEEHNIFFFVDESNNSFKYTRNRYRKNILPFLKNEDSMIHLKYLKFSEEANEYQNFVDNYVDKLEVINNNSIDLKKLTNESDFIKRKVIEKVIKNIQAKDWLEIDEFKTKELLKLMTGKNRQIDLNNGYIGVKEYENLVIMKKNNYNSFAYLLTSDIITSEWQLVFTKKANSSNKTIMLDSKEIKLPLRVRNRKNGDKIEVKNLNGTKKVNDIFITEKIGESKRDKIPLVFDSNDNLLWIPGVKKSKFAKNINEKYDIIIKYEVR